MFAPAALDARRIVVVVLLHGGERTPRASARAPRCRRSTRHGLEADQRSGIGGQAQPARRGTPGARSGTVTSGLQPLDPHVAVGGPQCRARCHGLTGPPRVVDAQRAAHLDGARGAGGDDGVRGGGFDHALPRGGQGHRCGGPQVDAGADGGKPRNRAQRRQAARRGWPKGGDDRSRPAAIASAARFASHAGSTTSRVHRIGLERRVEARDDPQVQAQQR